MQSMMRGNKASLGQSHLRLTPPGLSMISATRRTQYNHNCLVPKPQRLSCIQARAGTTLVKEQGIAFASLEVPPERTFGYQRCLDNESGEETNFGIVSNVFNKVLLIAVSGAGFNDIREEQLRNFVSENGGVWRYHNYGGGSINRRAMNKLMTMIVNSTACSPENPIKLIINLRDSQLLGPVLRDQYARQGVIFQVEYANSGVNHTAKWKDIKAKICKDIKRAAARILFMDFEEEAEHRISLLLSKMDAYVQTEGLELKISQKSIKSASQKKLAISNNITVQTTVNYQ